ncbi:MAG: M28 family peptidase [Candidatus Peregrinibacteria bacterium]|nr:M28 family peptidase [Candidatus Peregrinibacteria bacterium]
MYDAVDEKQLHNTLERVCDSSRKYPSDGRHPSQLEPTALKFYRDSARDRLLVLSGIFAELGYGRYMKPFNKDQYAGTNGLFTENNSDRISTLVVAHHDYRGGEGMTDNGSGLAALAEIARVIQGRRLKRNIAFASFDLEEANLMGSEFFAASLPKAAFKHLEQVICLDTVGYGTHTFIWRGARGRDADAELVQRMEESAGSLDYTFPTVDLRKFSSDHVPFATRDVPTVALMSMNLEKYAQHNGDTAKHWLEMFIHHTEHDTMEHYEPERLLEATRATVKFLMDLERKNAKAHSFPTQRSSVISYHSK